MATLRELEGDVKKLRVEQEHLRTRLEKLEHANLQPITQSETEQPAVKAEHITPTETKISHSQESSTSAGGIILIVVGALLCLTIIGIIIGIPLIIVGIRMNTKSSKEAVSTKTTTQQKPSPPTVERNTGMHWLGVIGMTALTIGVGYFVMYTVENNWFGPTTSIALSLLLSIILIISGLVIKGSLKGWGNILTAGGFALTYYTTYATYHFEAYREAFNTNQIVTILWLTLIVAGALFISMKKDNRIIASLSLLLAYITAFLSTEEYALTLPYILIISVAYIIISTKRSWVELDVGSQVLAYTIFFLWALQHTNEFWMGAIYLTLLLIGFTITHIRTRGDPISTTMAVINGLAYVHLFLFLLLQNHRDQLWLWALIMVAAYAVFELIVRTKDHEEKPLAVVYELFSLLYLFIAIPDLFDKLAITLVFVVVAALLLFFKRRRAALLTSAATLIHIVFFDLIFRDENRIIACLLGLALVYVLRATATSEGWEQKELYSWIGVFLVSFTIALEAQKYWITIYWAILGLALLTAGFVAKNKTFRIQGLVLFGLVVGKALFFDTSQLETMYKTLTFIIIGALLLLGSFMYAKFKDRLK